MHNRRFTAWLILMWIAAPQPRGLAAEEAGRFEVHDVSLWITDSTGPVANARQAIPSGLPVTVNSAREAASTLESRRRAPVQLLTFHGQPTQGLDVDLRTKSGTFLAHWPPGDGGPNRLRWSGTPPFNLVEAPADASQTMFVDADDWISAARRGTALFVERGVRSERFLAYDLELNLPAPVRLSGGPDTFEVVNPGSTPVYDVLIVRATPQGCRVAWLDELPPSKPAADPSTAPAAPTTDVKLSLFDDEAAPAKSAPAEKPVDPAELRKRAEKGIELLRRAGIVRGHVSYPTVEPAAAQGQLFGGVPKPAKLVGVDVALSAPFALDTPEGRSQTAQALIARLEKAGLAADEAERFAAHYSAMFFQDKALVLACRLSPATLDERVPLSVLPAPTKIVRVAMVLTRNADPQLGQEIEWLIAALGHDDFSARETAQQRLRSLGPLAFSALRKALQHADPEVVIRCERILLSQHQDLKEKAQPRHAPPAIDAPVPLPAN